MIRLMNSAMMPFPGIYNLKKIDRFEFISILQTAYKNNNFKSYIGYPANINFLQKITGIPIELNRGITDIENGDELLICKLKYRIADTKLKQHNLLQPIDDDYEFYHSTYFRERIK